MTKNLKAILSLFLAISLLLSLLPTAFAEEEITPIESSDIARLPAGNSEGRLIEAGMTVLYGSGETMKNAKYLVDGFHFSVPEVITYPSIDINQDTSSVTVTTPDSQSVETGTISLTETDNIIEFNYQDKKIIKRLEMWVWPVGAVKAYELQYKDDDGEWVKFCDGSFDQTTTASSAIVAVEKSAVSYIVNFEQQETAGIRFVAVEFKDGVSEAKIAEAVLRSSDEVNLLADDAVGNNATSNSWLYNGNNGFVRQASPYAWKFGVSGLNTSSGIWWSIQDNDSRINAFPPNASGNASSARNLFLYTKNDATFLWYGITLTKSPQKLNKITFATAGTGAIKQIEIYQSNLTEVSWPKFNLMPSGESWKKVVTVDCSINAGETAEIYLPNADAAEHWIINVSDWTESPQMCKPKLYVLGEDAEFPAISKAVYTVFDSLETDTDDNSVIHREIIGLKDDYIDYNGNEYTVEWSFETDSNDLLIKDGEALKAGFHETEEIATLTAKLTAVEDDSVSYTYSKEYTLLPISNELDVVLSDGIDGDADILSDGVYFSPFETNASDMLPADNYDKMVKVTQSGGYIDYNWMTEDNVSSLNLWVYPQGAISEWEIQYSADGVNYQKHAEGSFNAESISNSSAGSYGILFDEISTGHIRFLIKSFNEGFENAYITEAKPGKAKSIDYLGSIVGYEAYSHYMRGYVSSPVSDSNEGASKSQTLVWPVKNGENLSLKADNGLCWYAVSFSVPKQKINRITVPFVSGGAKTIEVLGANDISGFDYENSGFPACPDSLADYTAIAKVSGEFDSSRNVVIDIPGGTDAKYLLIKITGASNSTLVGKPSFAFVNEENLSGALLAVNTFFDSITTDTASQSEIKSRINLIPSFAYDGKDYSVVYTCDNALLNLTTGEVAYHDAQTTATITVALKESSNPSISYCASKTYTLLGMQSIYVQDENGEDKLINCNTVNDEFYYVNAEATAIPKYELDTMVALEEGDSLVFSWDAAKSLTRFEMWNWPVDSILEYAVDVSEDGEVWIEHYSGEIVDQFKDNPSERPALSAPESDYSNFYNIVFDEPTQDVQYIRFRVKALREGVDKAYILEAAFGETNEVDFLMQGSIKGSVNDKQSNSRYVVGNRNSIIGAYAAHETFNWPRYSTGSCPIVPLSSGIDGYIWYATSFRGAPVALNKVTLTVSAGTVYEYEVLYFKDYPIKSADAGFTWNKNTGQADPASLADYTLAARVSGEFSSGKPSQIHFDNEYPAKYWLVRVTRASDDARLNSVGFYQLSKAELSTSCYNAVLDNVFEGISDTALPNVAGEKLNLRSSIQMDANGDGTQETYIVEWSDNKGLVNTDADSADYGTFNVGEEDVEIELSAYIFLSGETSKHVRRQKYILRGKDNRKLTTLITENNIVLSENSEKSYDSTIGNGYEYEGKKAVEIAFNNEALQNGTIQIVSKDEVIAELPITDGKIVYNGTEISLDSKILIETEGNFFTVSKYGVAGYEANIYNENFTKDLPFEKIRFVTSASQSMVIDSVNIKVISSELFSAVTEQFDFSKISPSYRATNLNGNLVFTDMIADIALKIESADSSVVEIDDENNVGIVKSGTTTITATLTSTSTGATYTESFDVIAGKDNLAGVATTTSPAVPTDGTSGAFALDGSLETEFLTGNKSWSVNINLSSEKSFNKLCVFLPKGAAGQIESIKLLKSEDNIDYVEVCTVNEFEDGVEFEVPYTEAQFIRLEIVSSGIKSGIRDICIYNDMTDTDKLEYDFEKLTENLVVENGTIIPKIGYFGTNFSLSSNNTAVTIEETEDKNSWKIVTDTVTVDTNVTVTLSAKLGALEPLTKPYNILLIGEIIIGDNTVSGDKNNGFGGGSLSGGGGGGGGSSSSKPPKEESSQNTQISDSVSTVPSESIEELNNHWAESEIKTLIAKNIVSGDGISLNLHKNVTRAEFCKMIVAALGLEQLNYSGSFSDVSEKEWFAQYAETAFRNNIMSGDSNGFRGNDTITRQEVATVISNLLKNYFMFEDSSEEDVSVKQTDFADNDVISEWALEHVAFAAKAGIIKGYETGDFKPLNSLKRDESMVIVYRILSLLEK